MSSLDIGIDLGTTSMIACTQSGGIVVREPSVIAVKTKTGDVIDIGSNVYKMIGRTPDTIKIVHPIKQGVISDFSMTEKLIAFLIDRVAKNRIIKPRLVICVPSVITGVELHSLIDAATHAGARHVYLLEEPVAAALGIGIDISKPVGNMVVDIGGGTCDIAVLSLGGIVCKQSVKSAGKSFDEVIIRYVRQHYNILIGEKTAEAVKIDIGSVYDDYENRQAVVKGRDLLTGLPNQCTISSKELYRDLNEVALQIVATVQSVLERTPPELAVDVIDNGIYLTGGGSLIDGMDKLITKHTGVKTIVSDNAIDCVALGTVKSFGYIGTLFDGFVRTSNQ